MLVHAEIDGEMLEEHEIVMGFFLLMAAGNDSTKATYSSAMRALMENPDQRQLLIDDPALVPSAVEEALRMFPAFAHFRRTATRDTELNGAQISEGDKVVLWYPSSNRDETRYEDPDRFDVTRNPEHQAFGAGGRHFCLGTALARLELRVLIEETLKRYPGMQLDGEPTPRAVGVRQPAQDAARAALGVEAGALAARVEARRGPGPAVPGGSGPRRGRRRRSGGGWSLGWCGGGSWWLVLSWPVLMECRCWAVINQRQFSDAIS